ncbi:hypothetical protein H7E67_01275 [Clostridium gasigenes]|uniref:hypothetical protein n=1 Tax=Clostridium gasigenes TaxID=94869 RepID=UPI001627E9F0|nr:hypothetical protein [Clostridium gasigenes]MBB6622050.1 hypothetical protein [Clostridium gasigenes]
MKLEFRVVSLKEESKTFKNLKSSYDKIANPSHKFVNEFIIVADEEENYKTLQLHEEGLSLISDFKLDFITYTMSKDDFAWDGTLYTELEIPKNRLTVEIIDNIQRLNS